MNLVRSIGLMSGTSMDGVDVALIDTDGAAKVSLGATGFLAYSEDDRRIFRAALAAAVGLADRRARPAALAQAEALVTERHAQAVEIFLRENALSADDIDVIGFHGQTVLHRPAEKLTIQLGDGAALAQRLGISVVHDFRGADVLAGGQGAPVVPIFHQALVEGAGFDGPVALLNIGGVANLTYVAPGRTPIACDTGPGNALLDDLMFLRTGSPFDRHGLTAARGRVDETLLQGLLSHPFFALPPPKSLDRNAFAGASLDALSLEDAAATLTAFTAASIISIFAHLPQTPAKLIVCGGGARNPILLRELAQRAPCAITTADLCGWSADSMEAQAFAYLAVRSLQGAPLTFPTTTGAPTAMTGGVLVAI